MATHSSILAWRIPETEEPGRRPSTPADLSDPGIKPGSPALQGHSLPTELLGKTLIQLQDAAFTDSI